MHPLLSSFKGWTVDFELYIEKAKTERSDVVRPGLATKCPAGLKDAVGPTLSQDIQY